ncbi:hypothetical protein ES332_A11G324700v1 [Gossypium tomentosum]|uniref:Uncharacterized protein n=1 Tax=Gossypium tomentosum TaxID=34277 RepID=A0A5D2NGL2_GOSTO|nr:hypothetical protein ES332_A11G324700v1 [Gossypium tomentosum]
MGWTACCPLLIEVGSNVVFKWLSKIESRLEKLHYFFSEIERRSYLSFEKAEHMGNEMAFALEIARVKCSDTFKKHGGESVEENESIGLCLISCFISAAMYSVKEILQSWFYWLWWNLLYAEIFETGMT